MWGEVSFFLFSVGAPDEAGGVRKWWCEVEGYGRRGAGGGGGGGAWKG